MGKKQHQSDKLYLTATEWRDYYGGNKGQRFDSKDMKDFRRLPLDHCSLSLQPFEAPYCDDEGNIFDLVHIVPYIKKFKRNPVTGKPLDANKLTKLHIHKNAKGEMHCPVLFKVFTNNVHIAAIKTTGNVFSYEAINELNIKTKNWKDLLSSEPFTRKDIIVLQDPKDQSKFNLNTFHHLKNDWKVNDADLERAKTDPKARLKHVNHETRQVLDEMDKSAEVQRKIEEHKALEDKRIAEELKKQDEALEPLRMYKEPDEVRFSRIKKKGYVRLLTNMGVLNLELHCDIVHRTCEHFIELCRKGYYNNHKFHRSIRHFMIQCGDPEGTNEPGPKFQDEIIGRLHHQGRGVLACICGPGTNKSQL